VTSCPIHSRHALNSTPGQTGSQQLNARAAVSQLAMGTRRFRVIRSNKDCLPPPPREACAKIRPPAVKKSLRQASSASSRDGLGTW
jgi:hypothetical protein